MMNSPFSSPSGSYPSDPTHLQLPQPQDPRSTMLSSVAFPNGGAPTTSPIVDSTSNVSVIGGITARRVIHTSPIARSHEIGGSNPPDLNTCFSFDSRSTNNDSAILQARESKQPSYKTSPIGPRTGNSHFSRLHSSSSSSSTYNNNHTHKRPAPEDQLFEPRPQNSPRTSQVVHTMLKSDTAAAAQNNGNSPTPPSKRLRRIQNAFEHLSIDKNSPLAPTPLMPSTFAYTPFNQPPQQQQEQVPSLFLHSQTLDTSPLQSLNVPIREEEQTNEASVSMDATSDALDDVSSIASSDAAPPDLHGLPPILEKQKQHTTLSQNPVDAKIEEIIRMSRLKAEIVSQKEQMVAAGAMDADPVLTQDDFYVPRPHLAAKAGYQVPSASARPQLRQRSNSMPFFPDGNLGGDDMAID